MSEHQLSKEDESHFRKIEYLRNKDLMSEEDYQRKKLAIFQKYANSPVEPRFEAPIQRQGSLKPEEFRLVPKLALDERFEDRKKYKSQIGVPLSARTPDGKEKSRLSDYATPRTQHINRLDILIKELQGTPTPVPESPGSPRCIDSPRLIPSKGDDSELRRKDAQIHELQSKIEDLEARKITLLGDIDLQTLLDKNLVAYQVIILEKDEEITKLKGQLSLEVPKIYQDFIYSIELEKEKILLGIEVLKEEYETKIRTLEEQIANPVK